MSDPRDEEMIDVRDVNGLGTGIRKSKREVHRDGDWHRAVHVWIVTPSRQVLLQKRSRTKENHPGFWDVSAAGHISAGELAWDCAIRETREELGLEITREDLRPFARIAEEHVLNEGAYVDREIHEIFVVVKDVNPAGLTMPDGEVEEVRLVPVDEFVSMVKSRSEQLVPHWAEYDALIAQL